MHNQSLLSQTPLPSDSWGKCESSHLTNTSLIIALSATDHCPLLLQCRNNDWVIQWGLFFWPNFPIISIQILKLWPSVQYEGSVVKHYWSESWELARPATTVTPLSKALITSLLQRWCIMREVVAQWLRLWATNWISKSLWRKASVK